MVVDEVSGQWLSLIVARETVWLDWVVAFFLFRLFDIWKPGRFASLRAGHGATASWRTMSPPGSAL